MYRWLQWAIVLGVGWLAVAIYSYPGFMSFDSIEQLAVARGLQKFSDWHPPIMALLWRPLDWIVRGPWLMVMLQCGLLLGGGFALLRRVVRPWVAVAMTLGVFLWPTVFTSMAVVWKDSLMAGVLLASYAALTSERVWPQRASLVGFLFATMLRHNALFAVLPLLVISSPWPKDRRPWVKRGVGFAITVCLVVGAQLGNRLLVEEKQHPFQNSLAIYDIVGMVRYAEPLTDAQCDELLVGVPLATHENIQKRADRAFNPYGWVDAVWSDRRFMDHAKTEAELDAVFDAWLRLIERYPRAYISTRLRLIKLLLGFSNRGGVNIFNAHLEDRKLLASYGIDVDRGPVQLALSQWFVAVSWDSMLFRAYPYLVLALCLLFALRRNPTMLALLASALAYELALFVVAPSPDLRYSHWLILCALIALCTRVATAWTTGSARAP
ncbi:MAG: hypothetical protein HOV81_03280 [Kofleriaceae bacterium]|nr:hypothetical protein [Kofleriaceae bacterium]